MRICMLVACHKASPTPADPMYRPVYVGSAGKPDIPGLQRDDEGENISALNDRYCELTGLYWGWKHVDADYIGLCHYRRYLTVRGPRHRRGLEDVLTTAQAEQLLKEHRVIVPRKRQYYITSVYQHYADTCDRSHLDVTREILAAQCPQYLDSFDRTMAQTGAYIMNMYLMPKDLSDAYCQWLFPILQQLDRRIDSSGYTPFEKRYVGRVSERLFNVWLRQMVREGRLARTDIVEVPYLYIGQIDWPAKIRAFLQARFLHRKNDRSF